VTDKHSRIVRLCLSVTDAGDLLRMRQARSERLARALRSLLCPRSAATPSPQAACRLRLVWRPVHGEAAGCLLLLVAVSTSSIPGKVSRGCVGSPSAGEERTKPGRS
jgi:hypothetical protein